MRPRLARVAGSWLVLHLCLLVSVPTVLRATTPASVDDVECTCTHAEGQMCPMHRSPSKSRSTSNSEPCWCCASDPVAALGASLLGPSALLPPSTEPAAPPVSVNRTVRVTADPLESPFAPDSPPPRA